MKQRLAAALLLLVVLAAAVWVLRPGSDYAKQDREAIMANASAQHPAGTDQLGRDRAVRTAAALLLGLGGAVAASGLTTLVAGSVGAAAAFSPAALESIILLVVDLFLMLPWLFLLMMVRSGLPLTIAPWKSAGVTFLLLALLGWPACARAVHRGVVALRQSPSLLYGRANGLHTRHLLSLHVIPRLRPLLLPQFLICIPAFVIAEANLGTLGLGISEPMPSWGGMLLELNNSALLINSRWVYTPLVLLVCVLLLLEFLVSGDSLAEV